ncbi:hypothetical protein [Spirosoma luteum]|uniref:hypothetical protein n=1 Tax=Spirosoma luteum TaxID=431553 RepID=UPI0012F93489|nr:hypothetical protein [Spirosoma luteum]
MEPIEQIGTSLVAGVIQSQRQKGLRASGYSADNTRFEVMLQGRSVTLQLLGPAYWRQQAYGIRGRGGNRRPSTAFVGIIRNWIRVKGLSIPLSAAGAIAYNIVNNGIQVPNPHNPGGVLSDALRPADIVARMKATYIPLIRQEIKTQLLA